MITLYQNFSGWINPIDLKRAKRVPIEVKGFESVVGVPAFRKRVPTHGFDFALIRNVAALHDDYMLDMPNRAGVLDIQHTCSFAHNPISPRRNCLHC